MRNYFITGTSRGIGKSIAELLLKNENNFVTGFSRTNSINHKNYKHINIDLSDLEAVKNIDFPELHNSNEIILINNSGVISEILRIGKTSNNSIVNDYNVNIIAPSILINSFLKKYQTYTNSRKILNVSSGAGRHAIDAWATYCASKSAMDMLSETIKVEQSFFKEENRVKIFSVAPGVVDTEMQVQIRNTSKEEFSNVERFISLNENKELSSPEFVAEKLLHILSNSENFNDVILDIRNISA